MLKQETATSRSTLASVMTLVSGELPATHGIFGRTWVGSGMLALALELACWLVRWLDGCNNSYDDSFLRAVTDGAEELSAFTTAQSSVPTIADVLLNTFPVRSRASARVRSCEHHSEPLALTRALFRQAGVERHCALERPPARVGPRPAPSTGWQRARHLLGPQPVGVRHLGRRAAALAPAGGCRHPAAQHGRWPARDAR